MNANEIINLFDSEYNKPENCNFRSLWQETSDLMYPLCNQITNTTTPGEAKTNIIYDVTAKMESQNMASDLSSIVVPPGQRFFEIEIDRKINSDNIRKYLGYLIDATHNELFRSNFILQLNECIRSLIVFGTGNMYSEFGLTTRKGGMSGVDTALNFCDYPIGTYVVFENSKGLVDGILVKFHYTANQAVREWGTTNIGERILAAYNNPQKQNDVFTFIHSVRRRESRNTRASDGRNMPFESKFVNIEQKLVVDEGGFEEFSFHVPRWMKSSSETMGRGQGTEILPVVKMLQAMDAGLIDCANLHNNPPREYLDTFEGTPRTYPGAANFVGQLPASRAMLDQNGNFPITKEILEYKQEIVKKAFYSDVLNQLIDLKGDRRTTLEISERVKAGLKRLSMPVARLYGELFNTLIPRCIKILIRNGIVMPPPPEIQGVNFDIKYVGPLALALRNQQAQAYKEWLSFVAQTSQFSIDALDIVNLDRGNINLARAYGVNEEVIASQDEIDRKRQARAAQMQAEQERLATETLTKGYKDTTGAPEKGSPAGELMDTIK
jgi:hypothetical protein